ncbi:MAG: phenylpyruvate tautomerase MIF-related protein [Verrucomicrobiota bacterium]
MPFLELQTNQTLTSEKEAAFLDAATAALADALQKPERVFMSVAHSGLNLRMGGSADPAAVLDLDALGVPDGQTNALTELLTNLVVDHLGVPPERIFVRFQNYERSMWGCNGKTFA